MNNYSTSNRITYGQRILPIKLIEVFYPQEWEEFIEEWLELKKSKYYLVERYGGAGDMGRDVVCYFDDPKTNPNYKWDCYQCKHYINPITPTDVYVEFAKIIYYTFEEHFPIPQNYYFVAPKDCGTSLSKLLIDPIKLKAELKANWEKYCKNKITKEPVELKGKFLSYLEAFDFSIFSKIQRKLVIEEHSKHPNHLTRFGGSLPDRPVITDKDIPDKVQIYESNYIKNLIKAYNSTGKYNIRNVSELKDIYLLHFNKAREGFHFAEQLRVLYRDNLPINTFEDFQEEIYNGIINTLLTSYPNGFEKVKNIEDKSQQIQITSNPLKDVSKTQDRTGICHQLSNNGKINWENE
ncbi:ABC-three component system protein [Flavobacterium koreense]